MVSGKARGKGPGKAAGLVSKFRRDNRFPRGNRFRRVNQGRENDAR
ncbi:hypothetical protein GCM10029976_065630 [Kribbella albertanoniae]